jgi:hypothetical protein
MTVEHAEAMINASYADERFGYARMVLDHRTGKRKTLAAPKGWEQTNEEAAAVREAIDLELLREVPITVGPSPLRTELEEVRGAPTRFSVSFLGSAANCLTMAHLNRQHRVSGERAIRGSLFHQVVRILTIEGLQAGMTGYDEQEAENRAVEVMMAPEEGNAIALSTFFDVVEMVKRWARVIELWPDAIPHVEELFTRTVEVGGVEETVSGRLDLVQVRDGVVKIDDYKTSPHVPSQAEFERRIQTPMYAWIVADTYRSAHTFDVGEVYPSPHLDRPIRRGVELEPGGVGIDRFIHNTITNIRKAYAEESFSATPGSHCEYCQLSSLCPLPPELRPDAAITDQKHAEDALAWLLATEAQLKTVHDALRGYVAREEAVVTTGDIQASFVTRSRRSPVPAVIAAALEAGHIPAEEAYETSDFTQFVIGKVRAE